MSTIILAALFATIASVHGELQTSQSWEEFLDQDGQLGRLPEELLHCIQPLRSFDPKTDVKFYLYTKDNRNESIQINYRERIGAPFDGFRPTKFIVHGWLGSGNDECVMDMKNVENACVGTRQLTVINAAARGQSVNRFSFEHQSQGTVALAGCQMAFLDVEDVNVICVDWQGPASHVCYISSRNNVKAVGVQVGEMYTYLNAYDSSYSSTHCIGHSLGAHVCGFSGKSVNNRLSRITGMDPALPFFDYFNPAERLSRNDATYVDIIHTCAGWIGFAKSLGHSDFFPNGGNNQNGCGIWVDEATAKLRASPGVNISKLVSIGICDHGRSHQYFIESIKSSNFSARKCSNWNDFTSGYCNDNNETVMGNPSPFNTRGHFFLTTNDSPPYALGWSGSTSGEDPFLDFYPTLMLSIIQLLLCTVV